MRACQHCGLCLHHTVISYRPGGWSLAFVTDLARGDRVLLVVRSRCGWVIRWQMADGRGGLGELVNRGGSVGRMEGARLGTRYTREEDDQY